MESELAHLQSAVAAHSITAEDQQHHLIIRWLRLLQKWNATYNLSAKYDARDIIDGLVIDSLAGLKYLHGNHIVDVGSGAGIPGIILAIYCPDKHFTLVDSALKKTNFMEHCRITLNIKNISVQRIRVEDFQPQRAFDTIISKAFGKVAKFVTSSFHLGTDKSVWLTYKNNVNQDEFEQLSNPQICNMQWHFEAYDYQYDKQTRKLISLTLQ